MHCFAVSCKQSRSLKFLKRKGKKVSFQMFNAEKANSMWVKEGHMCINIQISGGQGFREGTHVLARLLKMQPCQFYVVMIHSRLWGSC